MKPYWYFLYGVEAISVLVAVLLTVYYNSLPGQGSMPGLTYFAETCCSFCAAVVFGVMLLCSVLAAGIVKRKKR